MVECLFGEGALRSRGFVEVADFRDHAEADGGDWLAQTAAVASECVEEIVGRAVVAFGCCTNTSRDRGCHEEEFELVIDALQSLVNIPSSTPLWLNASMPRCVRHVWKQRFVKTHSGLNNATDWLWRDGHASSEI